MITAFAYTFCRRFSLNLVRRSLKGLSLWSHLPPSLFLKVEPLPIG